MENNSNDNKDSNKLNIDDISKNKNELRPCCVCKDTRKIRDECIMFKSELECLKEMDDHKKCLESYGFKV